jgi:hypothetical protein
MADVFPLWCKPVTLDTWRTRLLEVETLHCTLPIHEDWAQEPKVLTTPMDVEHQYQGRVNTERLILNMMPDADPHADITNWVNGIMRLTGFPIAAFFNPDNPPQLLQWDTVAAADSLMEQLAVDELVLFEGLARIPDLMRMYILLARRDTTAWKITLTFGSAVLPGSDAEIVALNDHIRAGATFGYLQFQ